MTNTIEPPKRRGRPPKARHDASDPKPFVKVETATAQARESLRRYLPLPLRGTVNELHHQEAALLDRILRDRTSLEWHRMALEQTVKLLKEQGAQPLSEIGRE